MLRVCYDKNMKDKIYYAVIIGGGPCGASAAQALAKRGVSTLVLERCALPRYKSCSGMIIAKTAQLVERYFDVCIPDSVKCTPYDNWGMVFVTDEGKEYKFRQSGFNVWRSEFDNWLLSMAIESGAELKDGIGVVDVKDNGEYVETVLDDKSTVRSRYVIDCEGAVGAIKRKLIGGNKDYIVTYQAFYDGNIRLDPHYFYAYLQPQLSQYDAWFNVKDGMLVLGVAVKDIDKIRQYNEAFLNYMYVNHDLKIKRKIKEEKWIMPHIAKGCPIDYGLGRILFAGEVAGFLNPMGEGISCGMESGYLAGEAIADNFASSQKVLSAYRESCKDLHAYMQRQWHLTALMSSKFRHMKMQ